MRRISLYALLLATTALISSASAADTPQKPAGDSTALSGGSAPAGAAAEPSPSLNNQSPKSAKVAAGPTSIEVISHSNGMKSLSIRYRWSAFSDARIEMRLVPDATEKGAQPTPLYFHEQLKGRVREQLFDCLDHPGSGVNTQSFTADKMVYTMIGRRNSLANQAVHVRVAKEGSPPGKAPAAVFLQLDTWAIDKDSLTLDMPRDEFAQPGTLFLWFFRGNKPVWEEQFRWPGYK